MNNNMTKTNPKRNHHFLTKLYQRDFSTPDDRSFIWVYECGRNYYDPGQKGHHNPCWTPINEEGAENLYAYETPEGEIDFDSYEYTLEELEKPSDSIFRKLRSCQVITDEEKRTFASYMSLMFRRVPKRGEEAQKEISNMVKDDISPWYQWQQYLQERGRFGEALKISRKRTEYEERPPKEILLRSMVMEHKKVINALSEMNWYFFTTRDGNGFLTSDDPIYFPKKLGLGNPRSSVIFPISTGIALFVLRSQGDDKVFVEAQLGQVSKINQITLHGAFQKVYSHRADRWVIDEWKKVGEVDPFAYLNDLEQSLKRKLIL